MGEEGREVVWWSQGRKNRVEDLGSRVEMVPLDEYKKELHYNDAGNGTCTYYASLTQA